jgi:hypothetical protein
MMREIGQKKSGNCSGESGTGCKQDDILSFKLFEALGWLQVVTRFREGVLAAQIRNLHPCFRSPHKTNDLCFSDLQRFKEMK